MFSQKSKPKHLSHPLVMAFWTFDLFHAWHEYYLMKASQYGKSLIVVIARDRRVERIKWNTPIHTESARQNTVAQHFPHASVVLGDEYDIFAPIDRFSPDILALWYDQNAPLSELSVRYPTLEIVRIDGYDTEIWKSSKIRSRYEDS